MDVSFFFFFSFSFPFLFLFGWDVGDVGDCIIELWCHAFSGFGDVVVVMVGHILCAFSRGVGAPWGTSSVSYAK
jgi:hypothetical protein